jgi:hypothetical protein
MLSDNDDRLKWSDPAYKKKKAEMKADDHEDSMGAVRSNQCRKCGAQKVFGVHHCSKCKRCVY